MSGMTDDTVTDETQRKCTKRLSKALCPTWSAPCAHAILARSLARLFLYIRGQYSILFILFFSHPKMYLHLFPHQRVMRRTRFLVLSPPHKQEQPKAQGTELKSPAELPLNPANGNLQNALRHSGAVFRLSWRSRNRHRTH